ncbi:MAG: primosomal protein N' [Campylobacterota bacterium]|nr:primosomal protein N' [Campylobacterota bacterium]
MFFYEVTLLKSPIEPLTFQSDTEIKTGTLVEVKLKNRIKLQNGIVVKKVKKPTFKCTDISNVTIYYYNSNMLETASFISKYYVCSLGEALSVYTPFYETKSISGDENISVDIKLSQEQQKAYSFIEKNSTSLLFANTGSGKTEIYIKAIENILNQNKQALLLLPEISLSPQMEQRLQKVFKETIAIWHSKIQKKKKAQIVQDLLEGKVKIIAGARSALFLPYKNLGLIIVDEEHDDSYKSDQKPRLNTKDLSIYIGKKYDTQVILGSATPSLSSFHKIPYFRLKETYFKSDKKISFLNTNLNLNDTIIDKIKNTIENNNQVIVFLPTRANFKYQICEDCGVAVECPFCSVSLSLHKNRNALQCHYCNYTQAISNNCPSCKVGKIKSFRLGTAQVHEELSKIFPDKTIEKFDRDTIKTNTQLKKTIKNFNDKKIDILVGTQMLSKGHDYHNVTLAVVLGIDSVLNMTSYKVREKALSLLIQIAGRSGRKGFGEVLIQTKNEDFFNHYICANDYEDFLKDELKNRTNLYPPYLRLARVTFSHKNAFIAKKELDFYVQQFINQKDIEVIGFGESDIFKMVNKYRYELLLRSKDTNRLVSVLHSIKSQIASIDMDSLY